MSTERIPTTERLATALQQGGAPMEMIEAAKRGDYDDFKSHRANNIVALVEDLNKHKLYALAERAMNGEFDSTDWEAAEGKKVFRHFGLTPNV